jgi:hypothetical protein
MIDTHPEIPIEAKVHAMVSAPLDDMRKYLKLPADMTDKEVKNLQTLLLMPKEEREAAKERIQTAKALSSQEGGTQAAVGASTKTTKPANNQAEVNPRQAATTNSTTASKTAKYQPVHSMNPQTMTSGSTQVRESDFIGIMSRPALSIPDAANTEAEATVSIETQETATTPVGGSPVRPIARMRASSSPNRTAVRASLKVPEPMTEEEFKRFSEEQEMRKKELAKIYEEERAKILATRPDGSARLGPIPPELAAAADAIFAQTLNEIYKYVVLNIQTLLSLSHSF